MQFLLSELETHRYIEKEQQFDPNPFLGTPPDLTEYVSPVLANVRAELISSAVLVSGKVTTVIRCTCGRCLVKFDKNISGNLSQSIDTPNASLNVDDFIRETILLDLPLIALCQVDCLGLCPRCGQNRNEVKCQCPAIEAHSTWDALKDLSFPNKQSPSKEIRARRKNG